MDGTLTKLEQERGTQERPYLSHQLNWIEDPNKDRVRDKIFDHFNAVHPPNEMRLFTFPGVRWSLERRMEQDRARTFFIGIEIDNTTFQRSRAWMPDETVPRSSVSEYVFKSGLRVPYAQRGRSVLLNMRCSDFFRVRRTNLFTKDEGRFWSAKFRNISAFWLDFTSPICNEVTISLDGIIGALSRYVIDVPFAVTVLKARECADTQNKILALQTDRVGYLKRCMECLNRECLIDDVIEYTSSAGSPMITLIGRLSGGLEKPRGGRLFRDLEV
jgi:hypothetical protein